MENPTGESADEPLRLDFDRRVKLGLVTVWFRLLAFHHATFASKANGLMPPKHEWRRRAL